MLDSSLFSEGKSCCVPVLIEAACVTVVVGLTYPFTVFLALLGAALPWFPHSYLVIVQCSWAENSS